MDSKQVWRGEVERGLGMRMEIGGEHLWDQLGSLEQARIQGVCVVSTAEIPSQGVCRD